MRSWCGICLVLLLTWAVSAQTLVINLSGKVTNKGGVALEDAIVTLERRSVATETDAAGMYSINQTSVVRGTFSPAAMDMRVSKGVLYVDLGSPSRVRVEAYDVRGSLVSLVVNGALPSGTHRFPLVKSGAGAGVRILRIQQNGNTAVWRSLSTLGSHKKVSARENRTIALAKAMASVDTIRASKAGYLSKRIALTSYTGVVDIILDSLVNNGTGTSPIDDGSQDRIAKYGVDQYFWGAVSDGGADVPLVKITHAESPDALDVVVVFNPGFVDLTYGTGAQGWSRNRGHTFNDLVSSDHVEIAVMNCDGDTVFHGKLDLISPTTKTESGYAALGPLGGDGSIIKGDASDILSFGSSFDDNINYYGYKLFQDSPKTDSAYTPNPDYPYWQYYASYSLSLDPDAFGPSGYCGVQMTSVHASPAKTPQETITVTEKPGPTPGGSDDPWRYYTPVVPTDTTTTPVPPDTTVIPNPEDEEPG